jgi:hypothetical protein
MLAHDSASYGGQPRLNPERRLVSRIFASWNLIGELLQGIDSLRGQHDCAGR